jgi:hypothetical protein
MSNGIGTWFCKADFDPGWGWDDAVECAMFVYFPIWPLRVVHMRDVEGGSFASDKYQAIPLRWRDGFVRHVFLRRWFTGLIGLGALLALVLVLVAVSPPTGEAAREFAITTPILVPLTPCLIVAGIAGRLWLVPRTLREHNIRRVLGPHSLGTSDPATWVEDDLARVRKPNELFGVATFAEAVPKLLAAGAWTGAMWAARLTAALENEAAGEALTDSVLHHPGTQEALSKLQPDLQRWPTVMGAQALAHYRTSFVDTAGPERPETAT